MNEEILCVICTHRNVCKYCDEYMRFRDKVKTMEKEIPTYFTIKLTCLPYIERIPNPRRGSTIANSP